MWQDGVMDCRIFFGKTLAFLTYLVKMRDEFKIQAEFPNSGM